MRLVVAAVMLLATSAAPALALDMPARKAGLWQLTMNFEGGRIPQQSMKQCVDAATDKEMNSMGGGMQRQNCSQQNVQRVGETIVVDSVCKFETMTNTSHAVVTGDFNSAYTVKVDSKRQGGRPIPGMPPAGETHMTIEAKWLGPCAAGQHPGDMIMSNGMTMNIHDIAAMRGGAMPGRPGMPGR
jgi:hypothetical protein